jgi:hypothetical protein
MSPRFSFGVECEVAFLWGDGTFADFSTTTPDPDAHLLYRQTGSVAAALGLLRYA